MNGAGNDFIMIDNRTGGVELTTGVIARLCDRKRGVGADGVIVVESEAVCDFRMRYYNADGGEAEMCGNGARCAAWYAVGLGLGTALAGGTGVRFVSQAGPMSATVTDDRVAVAMTDATSFEKTVSVPVADGEEIVHLINTGVPHAVRLEPDWHGLTDDQVVTRGRRIRLHEMFAPAGVNANFVTVGDDGLVKIRTYERGVEAETLACGTGSVAAAIVLSHIGIVQSPVRLLTHGGDSLTVSFDQTAEGAKNVILEGPAAVNFTGSFQLPAKE
ncbi:MAG: diaminopimelate epimerase [Candidatus Latescibacterota bacterium]|nr:MAG: diaminopimelate epimerase [Candidatus Latescibacterota bacterium]